MRCKFFAYHCHWRRILALLVIICTLTYVHHLVTSIDEFAISLNAQCLHEQDNCTVCESPVELLEAVAYYCIKHDKNGKKEGSSDDNDDIVTEKPKCKEYEEKLTSYPVYDHRVSIRFIVLTYNRSESLRKCLDALTQIELDGELASIDIWIDRNVTNHVDEATLQVAATFQWLKGDVSVHVHTKHVGLYGQWIDTWRPAEGSKELALFIEDDVDVSPKAYRWLREVHALYGRHDDIIGYSLQDQNILIANGKYSGRALLRPRQSVYLYRVAGSWGFAPHPTRWRQFQEWYHAMSLWCPDFRPYVKNAGLQTSWFKSFESLNKTETMWTIWLLYFTDSSNLFTLFANYAVYMHRSDLSLARNRLEPGLHFASNTRPSKNTSFYLLRKWGNQFTRFPYAPTKLDYDGRRLM